MILKKTALLFVLLANIVILVHAVAPHHHHHNQVCIENVHCQNDCTAPKHTTSEHNQLPTGSEVTDNCALKQAVVIPSNSFKQALKCNHYSEHPASLFGFLAVLRDQEFILFEPKIVSGLLHSQVFLPSSNFHSSSAGLRAPPTV